MKMEKDTLLKVVENEIITNLKHRSLTPLEMAELIDDYLTDQIKAGVKLEEIEQKLGVTKRVLYKYRSLLKLPKETMAKYKDKLSFEQMSIVTYSVKDKAKIPQVLEEVTKEQIPSNELVYRVAEINDKTLVSKHILGEIERHQIWAIGLKARVSKLPRPDQKRIREAVEDLVIKLNGV